MRTIRAPHYDVRTRPFIIIWEVTRACQLACLHCRASAIPHRDPQELGTEEARRLIDQVAACGPPPPLFVLTGGDPFQRADLLDLVTHAAGRGLPVSVSPSGTPALTPENVERLRGAGAVAISLSVDGSTPAIHDGFRGVEGVYAWTLGAWEAARRVGLKVQINTTVTPHNIEDIPDIAALVLGHGAMAWSAFFLVPTGRGAAIRPLTAEICEDVLHVLYDASQWLPVKTTEGHHYKRVVVQRRILEQIGADPASVLGLGETYRRLGARLREVLGDPPAVRSGPARRTPMDVNAAKGFVFISHTGRVYPSGFLPLAAGDIRSAPLLDIYRTSALFQALRDPDRLRGRCARCEFRHVCGGSRSRAFAVTGDYLAEEPWCAYEPGSFPYQAQIHETIGAGRAEGSAG